MGRNDFLSGVDACFGRTLPRHLLESQVLYSRDLPVTNGYGHVTTEADGDVCGKSAATRQGSRRLRFIVEKFLQLDVVKVL